MKRKLTDKELTKLGNLVSKYQEKMRLEDWRIFINAELVDSKDDYAYMSNIDCKEKTAMLEISVDGYNFDWDKLVIHELTHLLLRPMREKVIDLLTNRDKFIETEYLSPNEDTKMLKWANNQMMLIEKWLQHEEEIVCTQMESIVSGAC